MYVVVVGLSEEAKHEVAKEQKVSPPIVNRESTLNIANATLLTWYSSTTGLAMTLIP